MPTTPQTAAQLVAGRLALDFANLSPAAHDLSWDEFVSFLVDARLVSEDRAARLRPLLYTESRKACRCCSSFSASCVFANLFAPFSHPLSTRSHSPLPGLNRSTRFFASPMAMMSWSPTIGAWSLQFVARESSLDWLLAALARSAAELLVEGPRAPIRRCANSSCRLFFYDDSRTHRRRWCSMAVCGNRHKVAAFLSRRSPRRRDS